MSLNLSSLKKCQESYKMFSEGFVAVYGSRSWMLYYDGSGSDPVWPGPWQRCSCCRRRMSSWQCLTHRGVWMGLSCTVKGVFHCREILVLVLRSRYITLRSQLRQHGASKISDTLINMHCGNRVLDKPRVPLSNLQLLLTLYAQGKVLGIYFLLNPTEFGTCLLPIRYGVSLLDLSLQSSILSETSDRHSCSLWADAVH